MFTLFQIVQIVLGLWMWTYIGRGALALLAGERRRHNPVYRALTLVVWPVDWLTRRITPAFVLDRHIPGLALLLVVAARVGVYAVFYTQNWIPPVAGAQ